MISANATYFTLDLKEDRQGFLAHSKTSTAFVGDLGSCNLEFNDVGVLTYGFSPYDNLATFTSRFVVLEVSDKCLIPRTHDETHACFKVADFFRISNVFV